MQTWKIPGFSVRVRKGGKFSIFHPTSKTSFSYGGRIECSFPCVVALKVDSIGNNDISIYVDSVCARERMRKSGRRVDDNVFVM